MIEQQKSEEILNSTTAKYYLIHSTNRDSYIAQDHEVSLWTFNSLKNVRPPAVLAQDIRGAGKKFFGKRFTEMVHTDWKHTPSS